MAVAGDPSVTDYLGSEGFVLDIAEVATSVMSVEFRQPGDHGCGRSRNIVITSHRAATVPSLMVDALFRCPITLDRAPFD